MNTTSQLRVCYFGTYRAEYSRNQIMIDGLRQAGVEVIECHQTLWKGLDERIQAASGGWVKPAFWKHVLSTYMQLLRDFRYVQDFDLMVVGYPGQFDVFLARILCWQRKKPLVWDVFMSIYLIALERDLHKKSRFTIQVLCWIEKIACRLPDLLIIDTSAYAKWFEETHQISHEHFRLVPTGADNRIFQPLPPSQTDDGLFHVLYYGSFIPNHGVPYILEAANLLKDNRQVVFEMIGDGPDKAKAQEIVKHYGLKNVQFTGWLEQRELIHRIAAADVCLGAFGLTPQSLMTVQNKIYEGFAMAKPVINGDSPAIRQFLSHSIHIYLCERANPQALAEAILFLMENPEIRKSISRNGWQIFQEQFSIEKLGQTFRSHLLSLQK